MSRFLSLWKVAESLRLLLSVHSGNVSVALLRPFQLKARADFLSYFGPKCLGSLELAVFQVYSRVVSLSQQMPTPAPTERS